MDLYQSIFVRKSCRSFAGPVDEAAMARMNAAVAGFAALDPGIELRHRIVPQVKGRFGVKAEQYLIVSGNGAPHELENAGFVYEQLVLWLCAEGVGTVWLGASRDVQAAETNHDIIAIALGRPEDSAHRDRAEFKRRPVDEITNRPEDERMDAVRLAPSGMNLQPWYFAWEGETVHVYRQKLKPPASLVYKLADLDMGIALAHLYLALQRAGRGFHFTRREGVPSRSGHVYFGSVDTSPAP